MEMSSFAFTFIHRHFGRNGQTSTPNVCHYLQYIWVSHYMHIPAFLLCICAVNFSSCRNLQPSVETTPTSFHGRSQKFSEVYTIMYTHVGLHTYTHTPDPLHENELFESVLINVFFHPRTLAPTPSPLMHSLTPTYIHTSSSFLHLCNERYRP